MTGLLKDRIKFVSTRGHVISFRCSCMRALPRKLRLYAALVFWLPLAARFVILSMVLVCVQCFSPQPPPPAPPPLPALVLRLISFVLFRVPDQWCGEGHKQNGYLVCRRDKRANFSSKLNEAAFPENTKN